MTRRLSAYPIPGFNDHWAYGKDEDKGAIAAWHAQPETLPPLQGELHGPPLPFRYPPGVECPNCGGALSEWSTGHKECRLCLWPEPPCHNPYPPGPPYPAHYYPASAHEGPVPITKDESHE